MNGLNKKQYDLDFLGLLSIGILSLGYVVFVKGLAERHIQLPFLNFPIFVGEIFLFICLVIFFAKYQRNPQKLTKWHCAIIAYFIFVILKALYGYCHWGPLAFRHAALLYYPVFAVFTYAFFRKDFFNERNCLVLSLLIAAALFIKHWEYWSLTLVLLGAILIKSFPNKTIRWLMFLVFAAITPYKEFFQTARMMIVGNFGAGLYLAGVIPAVLEVKKRTRFMLTILIGVILIAGLLKFANHGAVKSIVAFKKMAEVMKSCDAYINVNAGHFKMEERKEVKLYNPDKLVKSTAQEEKLKQIIVEHVKGKIADFAFEHSNENTQKVFAQEMKQEVESVLDMQLLKENPQPAAEPIKAEMLPAIAKPVVIETHQVKIDPQTQNVENEKARMRQILSEQVRKEIQKAPVEDLVGDKKQLDTLMVDDIKKKIQKAFSQEMDQKVPSIATKKDSIGWVDNNNAVFRILIWRDMLANLAKEKPILGFDFGNPFRSKSLEILDWGTAEWARDGWIEPHNSYFHIIYRAGLIGILLIFAILAVLLKMIRGFIRAKSFAGVCLCGIIINWFIAANFLVIFELPYTAIPIWAIYGMTLAYYHKVQEKNGISLQRTMQ